MRIHSLDGHREIGHEGDIFGFNAALYTYPDVIGVKLTAGCHQAAVRR
jgi:hypothetical protein